MNEPAPGVDVSTIQRAKRFEGICDEFETQCSAGNRPIIESFLLRVDIANQQPLLIELIAIEMHYRRQKGESISFLEYQARFPGLSQCWFDETIQRVLDSRMKCSGDVEPDHASGLEKLSKYLHPSSRPSWLGRLAHYELERILGQGAFGIVLKAFDERLHRVVAIKFMNPDLATTSPPRKRFLREARTAAAIRHENIVGIHAIEEEPLPYIVMEYIPGITLQQFLDQNGPLELLEFLPKAQQIAAGLAAAHAANLIHRDIKPSNILLEVGIEKRVKISDFGLARAIDDGSLTSSGLIAGTPMYMAPEQARGEVLDHRADLFSLGCVFYQMVSGRPPFRAANTIAVLKRVCDDTPRPIQDVIPETPDWLCAIIDRLLEKKPANRFQTAKEVAELLARCHSELKLNGKVTSIGGRECKKTLEMRSIRAGFRDSSTAIERPSGSVFGSIQMNEYSTRRRFWLLSAGVLSVATILLFFFITRGSRVADKEPTAPEAPISLGSVVELDYPSPATELHVWPDDAPSPAIAPFDAENAKQHQEAWAKYLKVPVEFTNSIGMKFRLIPPGEFTMGSTAEQIEEALKFVGGNKEWQEAIRSEAPQHLVKLTKPMYLGVTEVTQADYEKVMGANPSYFSKKGIGKDAASGIDTSLHPVELVTWNDAAEFCSKISKKENRKPFYSRAGEKITQLKGTGYRLPTEAEWEFACRGGSVSKFWIGDSNDDVANAEWCDRNSEMRPQSVGQRMANPFGLFDMHGNVCEWTQDNWQPNYFSKFKTAKAIDPTGPSAPDTMHVTRGGCFAYNYSALRTTARYPFHATSFLRACGFRVALAIETR